MSTGDFNVPCLALRLASIRPVVPAQFLLDSAELRVCPDFKLSASSASSASSAAAWLAELDGAD